MAHEIENKKFVSHRVAPWHNLGTIVDHAMTSEEACEKAGMNVYVEKQPMFIMFAGQPQEIPMRKAVVRVDDNRILGVVGNDYQVIQEPHAFSFMDSIIGEGRAVYETAGSLRNGSRFFMTVKLPEPMKIGPDKVEKYLLLSSSHDGSLALRVMWTPIRVVCMNTLSAALGGASSKNSIAIRHTSGYKAKVAEARRVLSLTEQYYHWMEESFNKMLETEMDKLNFEQFVKAVFPDPEERPTKAVSGRLTERREHVKHLFTHGVGHANIAGTRWAAYNAVAEWVDHYREVRETEGTNPNDTKFESVLWGLGNGIKQKAYDLLKA